ncbi:hypothetical protein [Martelella alba]|uniref:Uncharacterized protein n=1 Tax=Martelella alba TaxID=2590451 RepID=A0ABY2SP37_9HYPH|nr:hypothetical protein [Martelella alba]TKI05524.1 hypothetical protein FCN80_14220 [Martelella alba]
MRYFGTHRRHPARFGLLFLVMVVVLTLLVMSLWNTLFPALFGFKSLSFWNALGLLVLCRILFGGMGVGPLMFKMARDNRQLHERWLRMSDEEKQAFFQARQWGHGRNCRRCGPDAPEDSESSESREHTGQ